MKTERWRESAAYATIGTHKDSGNRVGESGHLRHLQTAAINLIVAQTNRQNASRSGKMWTIIFNALAVEPIASDIRWNLLFGDVLSTIAVGFGIVWESGPSDVRKVADRLVLWGIVAETLCSVALFTFDEGISRSQQSKIATLEARIAPRLLKESAQNELTAKLVGTEKQVGTVTASPSLPESEWFARVLTAPLKAAGWDMTVVPGSALPTILQPTGVVIEYRVDLTSTPQARPQTVEAANRLAAALNDVGIDATATPGLMPMPMTMQIIITPK